MRKYVKNLLIPHEGNNFKPNFLEKISMLIMLGLVLMTFAVANLQALLWMSSDYLVGTVFPAVVVDLTNEERTNDVLITLKRSSILDEAARLKAEHMVAEEYFAHYSPGGLSPWYWFDEAGYRYKDAGENLAVHFTDSDEVVDAWMDSPLHKANILNKNYTEIGVGTAEGVYKGYPTLFVVQLFGTPREARVATLITEPEPIVLAESSIENDITIELLTDPSGSEDSSGVIAQASFETETAAFSSMSTTTEGVPQTRGNTEASSTVVLTSEANFLERSAVVPSSWLGLVYTTLAIFVVLALMISFIIEWRRQHPIHIAFSGGLIAVMALLFYIHTALTSGVIIV